MLFDLFICHASEDKDKFVRPLAEKLRTNHIEVWYDEFSLRPGDSLRKSIDIGLSKARYGLVVLSKKFVKKGWPQWELDGLVQRQVNEQSSLIIPIWHEITRKDILKFSPPLADKVAIKSDKGLNSVVAQILQVIKPEGSTLLIARDILLKYSYNPPVVTDDWWLDVIEYSASNPVEATFQEASGWGRWGFPLPPQGEKPLQRGKRLAFSAMQMLWQKKAMRLKITQISHPHMVLKFIKSTAGLAETCHKYPHYLAVYAPQLTIKGFGGEFEADFNSLDEFLLNSGKDSKRNISCDIDMALRHPSFGGHGAANVACNFILGDDPAATRPSSTAYEIIDYVIWHLSSQSNWMPKDIHRFLLQGLKEWAAWPWFSRIQDDYSHGFKPSPSCGSFYSILTEADSYANFKLTRKCIDDIKTRFSRTIELLKLKESVKTLLARFIEAGFIEEWFKKNAQRIK